MFCSACGKEIDQDSRFCCYCGNSIHNTTDNEGNDDNQTNTQVQHPYGSPEIPGLNHVVDTIADDITSKSSSIKDRVENGIQSTLSNYSESRAIYINNISDIFVDSDEVEVSSLGNGWLANFLAVGAFRKINAILTDKRLYFQGKVYDMSGHGLVGIRKEQVVNIEDVSGTRFIYRINLIYMLVGLFLGIVSGFLFFLGGEMEEYGYTFIAVLMSFLALWLLALGYIRKKCHFCVEYVGGAISFDVVLADMETIRLFDKEIHRMKDERRRKLAK